MSKVSKSNVTIIIIVLCLVVFGGVKMFKSSAAPTGSQSVLPQRAHGNPKADIKIIEFIDFQCPACASGVKILREYFQKYPDKIYVELRYFPLQMHQHGMSSARWAECAARQKKFWPFFDRLIDTQQDWAKKPEAVTSFLAIAQQVGLDKEKLIACLNNKDVDKTISTDVEEGKMRSVNSTPTYFVNHEMVVGTKSLKTKLDSLLGIANSAPQTP